MTPSQPGRAHDFEVRTIPDGSRGLVGPRQPPRWRHSFEQCRGAGRLGRIRWRGISSRQTWQVGRCGLRARIESDIQPLYYITPHSRPVEVGPGTIPALARCVGEMGAGPTSRQPSASPRGEPRCIVEFGHLEVCSGPIGCDDVVLPAQSSKERSPANRFAAIIRRNADDSSADHPGA